MFELDKSFLRNTFFHLQYHFLPVKEEIHLNNFAGYKPTAEDKSSQLWFCQRSGYLVLHSHRAWWKLYTSFRGTSDSEQTASPHVFPGRPQFKMIGLFFPLFDLPISPFLVLSLNGHVSSDIFPVRYTSSFSFLSLSTSRFLKLKCNFVKSSAFFLTLRSHIWLPELILLLKSLSTIPRHLLPEFTPLFQPRPARILCESNTSPHLSARSHTSHAVTLLTIPAVWRCRHAYAKFIYHQGFVFRLFLLLRCSQYMHPPPKKNKTKQQPIISS